MTVNDVLRKASQTVSKLLEKFQNVDLPPERKRLIIEELRKWYITGEIDQILREEAEVEPTTENKLFYIFAILEGLGITGDKAVKAAAYITGKLDTLPYDVVLS